MKQLVVVNLLMMYWTIAVHVIILINLRPVLLQHVRSVCVKPTQDYNDAEEDSCKKWFSVLSSPERYFTSHTHIKLLPGVYRMNTTFNLSLTNVTNFSIAGSEAYKGIVVIKCFRSNNNKLVNISNSSFVEVKNIKFINCGRPLDTRPFKSPHLFPSTAAAAMVIHNVNSMAVIDVCFKNSYGHGIFALNVMGNSQFKNITVFLTKLNRTRVYSGGIILLYNNAINHKSNYLMTYQNVSIENFKIYNISSINQITWNVFKVTVYDSSVTSAAALGVMFDHNNFSVRVVINNSIMSNISSKTGPIVYALYNSSNSNNSITIRNTSITNNINEDEHPNIKISIGIFPLKLLRSTYGYFELHHCVLSFNKAESNNLILQGAGGIVEKNSTHVPFTLNLTSTAVTGNAAVNSFFESKFIEELQMSSFSISIVQCTFTFNSGFTIEVGVYSRLIQLKNNIFHSNAVSVAEQGMLVFDKSYPTFEGYNEFINNVANVIIAFHEYAFLKEGSQINISFNTAILGEANTAVKSLLFFKTNNAIQLQPCAIQFLLDHINKPTLNYSVVFHQNQNYSFVIYGALLSSCHWLKGTAFKNFNSSFVYKRVIALDSSVPISISRQKSTIYCCDDTDKVEYFRVNDRVKPIFPGQHIPIRLALLPPFSSVVINSVNFTTNKLENEVPYDYTQCEIQPYQFRLQYMIQQNCTSVSYKVYSNTFNKCYVFFKTAYPDNSFYIYHVEFTNCPLGFSINNGSCECDKGLRAAFPDISCDIQTSKITRPIGSWIGSSNIDGRWVILYTRLCTNMFCNNEQSTNIQLHSPDTQCMNSRAGVACGQCSSGRNAVFGSLKCMECSNTGLLLLPVFMLAGVFLVIALFALDLTVVDGKINGFIWYTNSTVAFIYDLSPPSFILIPLSLFNLDLGIETCFYHGMTEYHKTWLQFAFPLYLILIVAVLVFASRYCSLVEKLTRRRVIPVIATIFLLSYNKLLSVTVKVLFSFTNIYSLPDNNKTVIWKWDSSIPLFGLRYSILFVVCLIVFLFILIPLILLLCFTKHFYRCKFIAKYLKPYLDAFQAPFKDSCRYYPGMELFIRCMSFVVGNRILNDHKTQAFGNLICVLVLMYLCSFKPFKSISNTILYTSFVLNVEFIVIFIIFKVATPLFKLLLCILILVAFAKLGGIILYCFYVNYLYKVKFLQNLIVKVNKITHKFKTRNTTKHDSTSFANCNYQPFQEELLDMDPLH